MKTDDVTSDRELHDLLVRTMNAVADGIAEPRPLDADVPLRRRWLLPSAAATIVAAGVAALFVVASGDREPLAPLDGAGPTLHEFQLTDEETATVAATFERMLRDCMATRGQGYRLRSDLDDRIQRSKLDDMWGQIGRTDAARAGTLGYQPNVSSGPDPNATSEVDPDFATAYWGGARTEADMGPTVDIVDPRTGTPTASQQSGGCFGQAMALMYVDQGRFSSLNTFVANELTQVQERFIDDARLNDALDAWSSCMTDNGYSWSRPTDPPTHFAAAFEIPNRIVPAEEIAAAVDDVACKTSTGLLTTAAELRDTYSRKAVAEAPEIAAEHRRFLDAALVRSARFDAGQLQGPWRQTPSPDAPANSRACTWLPDGTAVDMSPGERKELVDYLTMLATSITPDDATRPADLSPIVPPPWLINGGTCDPGATADRVELALNALG